MGSKGRWPWTARKVRRLDTGAELDLPPGTPYGLRQQELSGELGNLPPTINNHVWVRLAGSLDAVMVVVLGEGRRS